MQREAVVACHIYYMVEVATRSDAARQKPN
jgi:hypothetical protein